MASWGSGGYGLGDAFKTEFGFTNTTHGANQPGTAGALNYHQQARDVGTGNLVQDPSTGYWYDSANGQTYVDANGQQPVVDPNVAQQVAQNIARSQALWNALPGASAQQKNAYAAQTQLAGNLGGVINGTAPSVAQAQLGQGVNDISANANAMAAGHTGESAALSHIQAMRSAGDAQAKANEDAAGLRAQETAAARSQLGGVLGAQANEGQARENSLLGAGEDYSKIASTGQAGQQGLDQNTSLANAAANQKWWTNGGNALAALA